jgi:hypothetical protein
MRAPFRFLLIITGVSLLALDLSSCASSAKYSKKVHTWEGKDEQALLSAWGQPDAIEPLHSGNRMFVYARLKRYPVAYTGPNATVASIPTRNPSEYSSLYIKCSTFFEINANHKVETVLFRGDECISDD